MSPDASLLAISDERDQHLRLRLAAWTEGFAAGADDGYRRGRQDEHDESARWWAQYARELKEHIPDAPEYDESVRRRLAAALAGERRDQAEHERQFVAEAFATPAHKRNDVQRGTVRLYSRRRPAAAA